MMENIIYLGRIKEATRSSYIQFALIVDRTQLVKHITT